MVTRKELARRANVAESTVTRVLNGGYASEKTREKVMKLAKELNYVPNALAQGLRTRRSGQIACVVPSIDSPFYGPVMQGVEDVAKHHDYVLSVYSSSVVESRGGTGFFTGRHDAVILISVNHEVVLRQLHGVRIPVVVYSDNGVSLEYNGEQLPTVAVNLRDELQEVVDYFVRHGHRHIGYIGTEDADKPANPRLDGFVTAMRRHELPIHHAIQFIPGHGSMESGYTGMAELVRKMPNLTAVVTMNDLVSFGAMRWMQDQGIRVPEDISIVGCDDLAFSSMCYPQLTTIQIPKNEIGRQLMLTTLKSMEDSEVPFTLLPTRMIVRASATNVRRI